MNPTDAIKGMARLSPITRTNYLDRLRMAPAGAALLLGALLLSGCTSLGASGPRAGKVANAQGQELGAAQIAVVELTDTVARQVIAANQDGSLLGTFGDAPAFSQVIGSGDTLDISIWESPPAALFGTLASTATATTPRAALATNMAQTSTLPPQMVDADGTIVIPFAGTITAEGLRPQQLERVIAGRLKGKANAPQVIVRITSNRSATATIVGDVVNSTSIPLTGKGERLLDAVAAAGGVKQSTSKMTVRLTRGQQTVSEPLDAVLLDPEQNIRLAAGDVVTVMFQPYTFTALGAVGMNAEIPFEATGLTLAQALGRAGGLQDNRANIKGVFIFRLERLDALGGAEALQLTPDGRVPVIYSLDLSDPRSFFVAQGFPVSNGDVLYISNAPGADLQKFVSIVSSMAFSIIGVSNGIK